MDDRSWILPIVVLSLWRGFAFGEKPLPKPKNFKVLLSTSSSLTVAWDMVPHDGFRETGYFQMRLKSLFGSFNVVDGGVPSSARAFTFPDLLPNTRYELKVTARWENNRTSATTYGMTGQDLTPRPPTQTCEKYAGETCDKYLQGIMIYVDNSTQLERMDAVVTEILSELDTTTDCRNAAIAMICQWVFKPCHIQEWVNSQRAIPRPICNDDCKFIRDHACSDVWTKVEETFNHHVDIIGDTSCESLPTANGGDFPECVSYGALESKSPENSTSCYHGNGEGYRGTLHKTEIAQTTCLHWIHGNDSDGTAATLGLTIQQAKEMKNYCRNPQGRGNRPWCYDGSDKRWAYCSEELRPCDEKGLVCEPLADPKSICEILPGFKSYNIGVDPKYGKTQARIEEQLQDIFDDLHEKAAKWGKNVDLGCIFDALSLMCYTSMPLCMQPRPAAALTKRPICQEYCKKFKQNSDCSVMVEYLQDMFTLSNYSKLQVDLLSWPLDCATLPTKNGGDSPECIDHFSYQLAKEKNDGNASDAKTCYFQEDSGVTYIGMENKTESGLLCQPWNASYPHIIPFLQRPGEYPELSENYCRNPDNRADRPWCYTMNSTIRWEPCLITQCDPAPTQGDSEENLTARAELVKGNADIVPLMVVGGIAGFVVITLCIITALYVVHRRKKAIARASTLPVSLMALNRTRTNSSAIENNPYYTMQEKLSCQEIDPEKIIFITELGEGNFGKVFKGLVHGLNDSEEPTTVAIKTLKADSNDQLRKEFYHEAQLMGNFNHKNIVKLLGVSVQNSATPCMLFEYMELGDLNNFLRECSRKNSKSDTATNSMARQGYYYSTTTTTAEMLESCSSDLESVFDRSLDADLLVQVAVQIAAGMYYLSHRRFVHRDLATRNCLITHGLTVKIADFGMSQDIYSTDYYRVGGAALLPVRWMPPEAIVYGKFTVESDVWSFGVVLWEIFSFAMQPYFGFSNEEVVDAVRRGRLLSCPDGCPPQIYSLMKECWNMEPEERPSFKKLYRRLSEWGPGGSIRRHTTLTSSVTTCDDGSTQESDETHDDVFEKGEGLHVQLPPTRNGKLPSAGSDHVSNGHLTNGHPAKMTITTAI